MTNYTITKYTPNLSYAIGTYDSYSMATWKLHNIEKHYKNDCDYRGKVSYSRDLLVIDAGDRIEYRIRKV